MHIRTVRRPLADRHTMWHRNGVSELKAEIGPAEAGFDPDRLRRIDDNLARYVDDGRLPGWLVTVSRHGRLAHVSCYGSRDTEQGLPAEPDTLWRIYSMTKPITSVAAMMLYEEGAFQLSDPVSRFIPSFAGVRVYTGGSDQRPVTVPATEPVRVWHLLTHTAGLTYDFHRVHPCDALYRAAGFDIGAKPGVSLAEACDIWAGIPLLFQPGAEWNYSVATDVLGRVVEVASGQPLDEFFARRIFGPLGMTDTAFSVPAEQLGRLAALYGLAPNGAVARLDRLGQHARKPPSMLSGGGGLVSTAADYHRFTQLMLHRPDSPAGELDGVRLLSPRTVGYMGRNHLPGGLDLERFGRPINAESPQRGFGFGLGFSVVIDPVRARVVCSPGEMAWGGLASTAFWIDPAEELTVSFFTQLVPSSAYPLRSELRQLVYQALV
jgi:CubicO group peptidase (beta-lactamase class C family)